MDSASLERMPLGVSREGIQAAAKERGHPSLYPLFCDFDAKYISYLLRKLIFNCTYIKEKAQYE